MEVLSYPVQSNGASTSYISCEFCARKFRTVAEKNVHVLDHFDHEICERCDQTLLRIGGHFYILHSTLTCNSVTDIKQEIEVDEPSNDGISIIKVHSIDAKRFTEADFEEEQKFDRDNNSLVTDLPGSVSTNNDANEQLSPLMNADDVFIKSEFVADDSDALSSSESQDFDVSELCQASSLEIAESETEELSGYTIGANGKYNCTKCGTRYLTKKSFKRRHQNPTFKCKECGVAFCHFSRLKDHYKSHTVANAYDGTHTVTQDEKAKLYNCDVCGTSNVTYSTWRRFHQKQNEVCTFCGRRFCFRKHLKQHQINDGCGPPWPFDHVEEQEQEIEQVIIPHQVSLADETSSELCQVSSLAVPESGNKKLSGYTIGVNGRYNCMKCGIRYLTKASFKRRHQNPTFKCRECGVAFCQFSRLKNHYKIHPVVNPYDGVGVRGKSTQQIKPVNKLKNIQCPIEGCNEMISKNSRRHHMDTKHAEQRFQCDICFKFFRTKDLIRFHILRVHVNKQTLPS